MGQGSTRPRFAADDRVRVVIDGTPNPMLLVGDDGAIVLANDEAARSFGYSVAELEELVVEDLVPRRMIETHRRERDAYRAAPHRRAMGAGRELFGLRKDGVEIPIEVGLNPLDIDGARFTLVAVIDVSGRSRDARQRLEHLLDHDPLTDLPNRGQLLRRLDSLTGATTEPGDALAVLLIDLDHFKHVNDSLGYAVGDQILLRVSERLSKRIGEHDVLARVGGDEFVVILTGLVCHGDGFGDPAETSLAERIDTLQAAFDAPFMVDGHELVVEASVGAAAHPDHADDAATLLRQADVALHRAKDDGRGAIRWFEPAMLGPVNDRVTLATALRRAIGTDEMSLVYQPQFELASGRLVGFEALARWTSPRFGPVGPDRFIPIAESSGLIVQLGEWVLHQACRDIAALQVALERPLRMAVNVSPRQLRDPTLGDQVAAALADAGLAPGQLELEITEGMLVSDDVAVISALRNLRACGVKVVVDDFGRGYSSLSYLTRFPVDRIKIDRSFVQDIADDADAAIVDAIISMGHSLGMGVVAEGVETAEQESYLRARGCDEVQGFRYGAGMPLHRAAETMVSISP